MNRLSFVRWIVTSLTLCLLAFTLVLVPACGDSDSNDAGAGDDGADEEGGGTDGDGEDDGDSTGGGGTTGVDESDSTGDQVLALYEGNYSEGTWNNQTFLSEGTVELVVTNLQMSSDFGGFVFGESDPEEETYTENDVSITDNGDGGVTVTGQSATFGNVTLTFGIDGSIEGSASNVPAEDIDSLAMTGSRNANTGAISLTVTITFTDATTATSVVALTKDSS